MSLPISSSDHSSQRILLHSIAGIQCDLQGQETAYTGKALATQTEGSEFDPQKPHF